MPSVRTTQSRKNVRLSARDRLLEPVWAVEVVDEPPFGDESGRVAGDEPRAEIVRQRRRHEDVTQRRREFDSDAGVGDAEFRRDVEFVAQFEKRRVAPERRVRPLDARGLERGAERRDGLHHVERVVGRRNRRRGALVGRPRADEHRLGLLEREHGFERLRVDGHCPVDSEIRLDRAEKLDAVRRRVEFLATLLVDLCEHRPRLVADADDRVRGQPDTVGLDADRGVRREREPASVGRLRRD